jgi:hypothetical protein
MVKKKKKKRANGTIVVFQLPMESITFDTSFDVARFFCHHRMLLFCHLFHSDANEITNKRFERNLLQPDQKIADVLFLHLTRLGSSN